jgi:hypothetical protein
MFWSAGLSTRRSRRHAKESKEHRRIFGHWKASKVEGASALPSSFETFDVQQIVVRSFDTFVFLRRFE